MSQQSVEQIKSRQSGKFQDVCHSTLNSSEATEMAIILYGAEAMMKCNVLH